MNGLQWIDKVSFMVSCPQMVVSFRRLNEFLGRTDLDDDVKSDAGMYSFNCWP